nr:MAG TPA: tail tape measure protein [Caudoviricetes sp.]
MELFKIFGTIALKGKDQFNGDLDESSSKAEKLSDKIGKGLGAAAKLGAKAVTAAASAFGVLTKKALDSYAEYEQLVGGVETLFGARGAKSAEEYAKLVGKSVGEVTEEYEILKSAESLMMEQAEQSWKYQGMSANEYMETATSFAAALTSSCEDAITAAELADMAIGDMSDNANKMGSDMASIQNAYQGFAKQNYTMLDNLKLGYGGTKEEMERLISDANKLMEAQGLAGDLTIDKYSDVVRAIHMVQVEMGVFGTTSAEAASTIQGSVNMMKAAWSNLLTGIGDDSQDFDKLCDNFVESVGTAAENIMPRLEQILIGVGKLAERLAPVVAAAIPGLVTTVLPKLVQAGVSMIGAILQGLVQMLPQIIQYGLDLTITLIESISSDPESLVETAIMLVVAIVSGLIDAIPKLIAAAADLVTGLLMALISNAPNLLAAGLKLVGKIAEGIANSLGEIVNAGAKVVDSIIDGIAGAWGKLTGWFKGLWDGLFGGLSANVIVNGSAKGAVAGVNGSHASGLDYVPFDGYIAELHKGEMVVPKREAQTLRNSEETDYLLRQILDCLKSSQTISINSREFGRLVRGVT